MGQQKKTKKMNALCVQNKFHRETDDVLRGKKVSYVYCVTIHLPFLSLLELVHIYGTPF